mmetsp:Transcript_73713/g.123196  ORF Transcript_73713/g.123196 Transcript_73713/m.123196 type:complete len:220 (+) Transcript_73713:764-1423(+)
MHTGALLRLRNGRRWRPPLVSRACARGGLLSIGLPRVRAMCKRGHFDVHSGVSLARGTIISLAPNGTLFWQSDWEGGVMERCVIWQNSSRRICAACALGHPPPKCSVGQFAGCPSGHLGDSRQSELPWGRPLGRIPYRTASHECPEDLCCVNTAVLMHNTDTMLFFESERMLRRQGWLQETPARSSICFACPRRFTCTGVTDLQCWGLDLVGWSHLCAL